MPLSSTSVTITEGKTTKVKPSKKTLKEYLREATEYADADRADAEVLSIIEEALSKKHKKSEAVDFLTLRLIIQKASNNKQGAIQTAKEGLDAKPDDLWFKGQLAYLAAATPPSYETIRSLELISTAKAVTARDYKAKAAAFNALGDDKAALEVYKTAVKKGKINSDIHSGYGQKLQDEGLHKEAIIQFKKALKISPKAVSFYKYLATSLEALGKAAQAEAAKLDPSLTETDSAVVSESGSASSNTSSAVSSPKTKPQKSSKVLPSAKKAKALQEEANKCFKEAEEQLRKALEIKPTDFHAQHKLFHLLHDSMGKTDLETLGEARKVVAADPMNAANHAWLGSMLHNLGMLTGDKKYFDEALEEDAIASSYGLKTAKSLCHNAGTLHALGRNIEAVQQFKAAHEMYQRQKSDGLGTLNQEDASYLEDKFAHYASLIEAVSKLTETEIPEVHAEEAFQSIVDAANKEAQNQIKKNNEIISDSLSALGARSKDAPNLQAANTQTLEAQHKIEDAQTESFEMQARQQNFINAFARVDAAGAKSKVIKDYCHGFIKTLSAKFAAAQAIASGVIKVDVSSVLLGLTGAALELVPFIGGALKEGVKQLGQAAIEAKLKESTIPFGNLADSATGFDLIATDLCAELVENKKKAQEIIANSAAAEGAKSGKPSPYEKFKLAVKSKFEQLAGHFEKTIFGKTPAEWHGHMDAIYIVQQVSNNKSPNTFSDTSQASLVAELKALVLGTTIETEVSDFESAMKTLGATEDGQWT